MWREKPRCWRMEGNREGVEMRIKKRICEGGREGQIRM
jgi:hypothetical protein